MSRPQSMPDFAALLDSSTSLLEKRIHSFRHFSPERKMMHLRKKPSMSLAAGLIMNSEAPNNVAIPAKAESRNDMMSGVSTAPQENGSLFYAYAMRGHYPSSSPYVLTFASAGICSRWWTQVQRSYPECTRPSPQFFVLEIEHMDLLRTNTSLRDIRNEWFYNNIAHDAHIILPLQNLSGFPLEFPSQVEEKEKEKHTALPGTLVESVAEKLDRLAGIVESNVQQIHALSVAQSAGLEHMQEINETNSTQIKALADAQLALQSSLRNHAGPSDESRIQTEANKAREEDKEQEQREGAAEKEIMTLLREAAAQVAALTTTQAHLEQTSTAILHRVDRLATSPTQRNANLSAADTASAASATSASPSSAPSPDAVRISPGPRKLNRKIKGVWYEYDEVGVSGSATQGTLAKTLHTRSADRAMKGPRKLATGRW